MRGEHVFKESKMLTLSLKGIKFLSKLKRRNNIIILSGFLKSDYKDIFNIISQIGYEVVKKYNKKEWLCLVIK